MTARAHNTRLVRQPRSRSGSILIGLLWCLALVAIVVMTVLHTSRMDLIAGKNYSDKVQAHYLAVAGIEKAKALLYQDARERSRSSRSYGIELRDSPQNFRAVALGRGQFSVVRRAQPDEGGGVVFGVSDEESRLNINSTSAEDLMKLDGMTPGVAAAIMDWRDEDNTTSPGGAEADYYLSLPRPRRPRNGPLQTVRELLMVRGVSPQLLLGKDLHQNGMLDPESDADQQDPGTIMDMMDIGWASLLTVDSSINNVNAAGQDRVDLKSADQNTLQGVKGITPDIARAIVAYRGQNQFSSIIDLLDVPAAPNQNQGGPGQGNPPGNQPGAQNFPGANQSGPKVISENLLTEIADDVAVNTDKDLTGVINVNSAPMEVLICLPGVTRDLAHSIIAYRSSNGYFPNVAALLRVQGMTRDILKGIAPRVDVRSETFRILCEGKVKSTGARQRIQEIVHVGLNEITTLSYREEDL